MEDVCSVEGLVGYGVWGVVTVCYVVWGCCDTRPTVVLAEIRKEKLLEASEIVCQLWHLFL